MGHQPRAGADLDPRGDDAIGTNLGRCGSACARIDKGRRVDGTGVLQPAYAEFGRAADFGLVLGQRADAGDAQEGFQGLPGTRSGAVRIGLPLPAILPAGIWHCLLPLRRTDLNLKAMEGTKASARSSRPVSLFMP